MVQGGDSIIVRPSLRFRIQVLGCEVSGEGFRVCGMGSRGEAQSCSSRAMFRVQGMFGCRVSKHFERGVQRLRFRICALSTTGRKL